MVKEYEELQRQVREKEYQRFIRLLFDYEIECHKGYGFGYIVRYGHIVNWHTDEEGEINIYEDIEPMIISKKFGFIKWLLDKGYIHPADDLQRIYTSGNDNEYEYKRDEYDTILMRLSIQDDPIWYLHKIISYKDEDE